MPQFTKATKNALLYQHHLSTFCLFNLTKTLNAQLELLQPHGHSHLQTPNSTHIAAAYNLISQAIRLTTQLDPILDTSSDHMKGIRPTTGKPLTKPQPQP